MAVDILAQLNPEQVEAVLHFDSPLLIIAGAGSGKTRVITHKIAYLVKDRNLSPLNVLGVTFTNRAANEMKERIEALTGIERRLFNLSTFHSLGLRILRESSAFLGSDGGGDWQVIDEEEQRKILERLFKEHFSFFSNERREEIQRRINLAKMELCYPGDEEALRQRGFSDEGLRLFPLYQEHLRENRLWDYEDLISLAVRLLRQTDALRQKYERKFRYVVVDEFQDTNPNQYELIKLIAGGHRQIAVVGDDDQAIYSWRGASVRFLFDFERDFPGARIVKLERNYRSTRPILDLANTLISRNARRHDKRMWTETDDGYPVWLLKNRSKEAEAAQIADFILELRRSRPDLFPAAVLYRINSQSLPFETEFLKRGIAFRIIRGLRFFDRKEIKDSLALLRLAVQPADDRAFLRLIEFLPLGIGDRTLETLRSIGREKKLGLFAALEADLPEKFQAREVFPAIRRMHGRLGQKPLSETLDELLGVSGYLEVLGKKGDDDRLMNVEELREFIRRWERENPGETAAHLFDRLSLDAPPRENNGDSRTPVCLLTMHNAKGLEFPTVIVSGLNHTYLPFFRLQGALATEEERRLFYVAVTRSIRLLLLSSGSDWLSPFLFELPASLYETAYTPETVVEKLGPTAVPIAPAVDERIVQHPLFGRGKIIEALPGNKLLIHFFDQGNKLIDTSVVKVDYL